MDLRVGAFPAEIAIEAGDPRRRLIAPAVTLDPLRGKIEAPFPIPDTVGAARGVEFGATVAVEAEPGYRRGGDNLERGNLGRRCRRARTRR
jgi:hypothetical protein